MNNTSVINFKKFIDYIAEYSDKKYTAPDRAGDRTEEMLRWKQAGIEAREEFIKLGRRIIEDIPELKALKCNGWIKGDGRSVNPYFWIEFKSPNYLDYPHSISLSFAKQIEDDEKEEYILSLRVEAKDVNCNDEDFERHNHIAQLPLPNESYYYHGVNNGISNRYNDQKEILQDCTDGKIQKVRIVKRLEKPYITERTNEIIAEAEDTVKKLLPYYYYIFNEQGESFGNWEEYIPNPIKLLKRIENKYEYFSVANTEFNGINIKEPNYVWIYEKNNEHNQGNIIRIDPFVRTPGKFRIWLLTKVAEESDIIENSGKQVISIVRTFEAPKGLLEYIEHKLNIFCHIYALMDSSKISNTNSGGENTLKNIILYGPPGTGKTYNTVCYAVAICEDKNPEEIIDEARENYPEVKARYDKLKNDGRIEFTTFHQSYGYEEFIEGIRPIITDDGNSQFEVQNGIFKDFSLRAKKNYDDSQKPEEIIKRETLAQDAIDEFLAGIEPGQDQFKTVRGSEFYISSFTEQYIYISIPQNESVNKVRLSIEEIRLMLESDRTFEKTGDITSFVGIKNTQQRFSYDLAIYKEIMKIRAKMSTTDTAAKEIKNYVFIIDEINRGNISKIFGELITLIEPSKRIGQPEELRTVLPYSKKPFGVPDNVYILGTMNTADRSIAAIDTALRRRFSFKEMLPDATVLGGVEIGGINIEKLLDSMNKKISVLFDREHTIGHAYFIDLLKAENQNIKTLGAIFKNSIIPLLQEYFYEDYEKIRLVLGDNRKKNDEPQFIRAVENDYQNMFGEDLDVDIPYRYEINEAAFENPAAYKYI